MKTLSPPFNGGIKRTSPSSGWIRRAIFCGAMILVVGIKTGNAQLSKADQLRFQQQQAAMERTARESMERMERQARENERINREARERQAALMQANREKQAESLKRQRE